MQLEGTLLSCIQPHVASALPSLELRLQAAADDPDGGRWASQSGWLPRAHQQAGGGDRLDASGRVFLEEGGDVAEQLRTAVSELLRQLVALDWALVCR